MMYENEHTRRKPELARRVQQLVSEGYNRKELEAKLRISRYEIDRLRGGTEPQGGMPMRRGKSKGRRRS